MAQGPAPFVTSTSSRRAWLSELRAIAALAIPVVIQTSAQQGMTVTDQIFLGHLGTAELAASALANAFTNLMWFFLLGFATALDTLGSHAYGAGDHRALITWCVVAAILLTLLVAPIAVGMAMGEAAGRVLFGQDDTTAMLMGRFCTGLIPGMWPLMWGIVLTKYLQVQNNMLAPSLIAVGTFCLNIAFNAALVRTIGFRGAPLATSLSRWAQCLLLGVAVWHHERRRRSGRLLTRPLLTSSSSLSSPLATSQPGSPPWEGGVEGGVGSRDGGWVVGAPSDGVQLMELAPQRRSSSGGDARGSEGACDEDALAAAEAGPGDGAGHKARPLSLGQGTRPGLEGRGEEAASGAVDVFTYRLSAGGGGGACAGAGKVDEEEEEEGASAAEEGKGEPWWRVALSACRAAMRPQVLSRFLRLGIPGGLSMSFEAGCFDFSTVLAGRLGPTATAAHAAMLSIVTLTYLACPFALATAGSIRVGNLLGANQPDSARRAGVLAVSISGAFMAVMAIALLACRSVLGLLFTRDAGVISMIRDLALFAALFQVSDGLMGSSQGVLRGCGHQHLTAVFNFTGFWVCGVLLGYLLCFKAGMGIRGLWAGISSGDTATCVFNLVAMSFIHWPREADKAVARLKTLAEQAEEEQPMLSAGFAAALDTEEGQDRSGAAGVSLRGLPSGARGRIRGSLLGGGRSYAEGLKRMWSARRISRAAEEGRRHGPDGGEGRWVRQDSVSARLLRSVSWVFQWQQLQPVNAPDEGREGGGGGEGGPRGQGDRSSGW